MPTTRDNTAPDGFIDKPAVFELLETTQDYITNIVRSFNVETIKIKHKNYYKIKDLQRVISEVDEFHKAHYSSKYVYKNIISLDALKKTNIEQVDIPNHYRGIFKKRYTLPGRVTKFYRKEDIDNYVLEQNLDGFIDRGTLINILEIDSPRIVLKPIVDAFNIETKTIYPKLYYKLEDVENAANEVKTFFDKHYTISKATQIVLFKAIKRKNIEMIDIPVHYRNLFNSTYGTKSSKIAVKKEDIHSLRHELDTKSNIINKKKKIKEDLNNTIQNEYLSTDKTIEKLSLTCKNTTLLKKLREERILRSIFVGGTYYYNIEDIENIVKKRKIFFKEYTLIGSTRCNSYFEEYNTKLRYHTCKLNKYEVPIYCQGYKNVDEINERANVNFKKAIKISELKKYLIEFDKRLKSKVKTDIIGSSPYETFLIRLDNYSNWDNFNKESIYTKEKYFEFSRNAFSSKTSRKSLDRKVKQYINLGIAIKGILDRYNVDEIYLLSHAQINLYLKSLDNHHTKANLYRFLGKVNMDLKKTLNTNKLKFNFDKVNKYIYNKEVDLEKFEDTQKELYNFETYAEVFNYLSNIDNHMPNIINEFEKKDSVVYASTWLYLLLHLNNAWRHGDCDRFPELIIKDLIEDYGIEDINWFKNNELTLPQSKAIIFRVRQWEMRMSKTQIKGVFFCSDELSPAFATVVIILHLYKYTHNVINRIEENNLIMNFGNYENEVTSTMIKNFFKPAKIKDFTFSSRKFNKSIMTYIYFLANLKGDEKCLIYAQKMRNHLSLTNTTSYVDFDIEKVESLSKQLFQRGEFGYIPALLSQKLLGNGKTGSFEEMTNQIMYINAVFSDIHGINNTSRFLNVIRSERQNVIDMISEKSFKECQEIFTNLFTMDLPSKNGRDIQCLFGKEGCQMPNLDDDCSCFDCHYHIPSIYALTRLCNNLVDNYKKYLGIPENIQLKDIKNYLLKNPYTTPQLSNMSKIQIGLKITRRKVLLAEAIKKFGADYVYRCLDIDRKSFLELSDIIKLDFFETYPELLNRR